LGFKGRAAVRVTFMNLGEGPFNPPANSLWLICNRRRTIHPGRANAHWDALPNHLKLMVNSTANLMTA
jgi:hypothetical protein